LGEPYQEIQLFEEPLEDDALFSKLVEKCQYDWYRMYLNPSPERIQSYYKNLYRKVYASKGALFLLRKKGMPEAAIAVERMEWDSRYFGFLCFKISFLLEQQDMEDSMRAALLAESIAWSRKDNNCLLFRRLSSSRVMEVRQLEDTGFRYADNLITFSMPVKIESTPNIMPGVDFFREIRTTDLENILSMLKGSFTYSRFVQDAELKEKNGEHVYHEWVKNLILKTNSDSSKEVDRTTLFGLEVDGAIGGFIAYRTECFFSTLDDLATIELIVVNPQLRKRGIAGKLIQELKRRLATAHITELEASTWVQQKSSVSLYLKNGFRLKENLLSFHFRSRMGN